MSTRLKDCKLSCSLSLSLYFGDWVLTEVVWVKSYNYLLSFLTKEMKAGAFRSLPDLFQHFVSDTIFCFRFDSNTTDPELEG